MSDECTKCGKAVFRLERQTVEKKFGKHARQASMCWNCADSWEPGDAYYERQAEDVADRQERERGNLKDAGR